MAPGLFFGMLQRGIPLILAGIILFAIALGIRAKRLREASAAGAQGGVLAYGAGSRLLAWMWRSRWFRRGLAVAGVAYVAGYVPLSCGGGYCPEFSGEHRIGGLPVLDRLEWQPRFGRFRIWTGIDGLLEFRAEGIAGYLYAPLIAIDQHCVHRHLEIVRGHVPPHRPHPEIRVANEKNRE